MTKWTRHSQFQTDQSRRARPSISRSAAWFSHGWDQIDLLLVPGGFGQQELMNDEEVLSLIRGQANASRLVFSVCTGALLCGAAGILRGRQATTHWSAWDLLPYYGAIPTQARVVVDGNLVTAGGVTAGLDGALVVASLLPGDEIAQQIQLTIQYAP